MTVSLSDIVTIKRLVATGNDELWYEDNTMPGTMVELAAASVAGQLDTSDQLVMFEGYQKVFVINGAKLKVADFVNTRLTYHTKLTDPPAKGDILTQATSNATMVVDFVDTTKEFIYGYVTSGTFVTTGGYTVTSNNAKATMNASSFVPDHVTAGPLWYDYTVYPDTKLAGVTTSYGTMPAKAYLGCLYRGRNVLAGNPNYPNQWYMSRVSNPFDYAYFANDDLSPVAGNNANAGEMGDIIRCLIPYKDDYLIFGCSSCIWVMSGDAASGGSLNSLSLTTGIFGANSYCWDDDNNLYFWGNNGLYKSTVPGSPVCLNEASLPKLVNTKAANPSTHRIVLGFDQTRRGILVTITKLSDGTNSCYWYDLRTGGFFPENYPEQCGCYSMLYYAANDKTLAGLLVGCTDGYIRTFDETTKSDDVGATTEAIDSYVNLGPFPLSKDPVKLGVISNLSVVLAGGGPNGSQSDSDSVTLSVFASRVSEQIIEKMHANTGASIINTVTGPNSSGFCRTLVQKIRGSYIGVRLANTTKDKSWAFEQLSGIIKSFSKGR